MSRHPEYNQQNRQVQRWLVAEQDREDIAEQELMDLFALLPAVSLNPTFAEDVLARIAHSGSTQERERTHRWPLELMAASLFLLTGLALRLAPYWLQPIVARVDLPTWPARLWQAATGLGTSFATVAEGTLESLRVSRMILTSPQGVMFVALCVAIAVLSARLLYGLLDERSTENV